MVFLKANDARNSANIFLILWQQKVSAQKKSRTPIKFWTRDLAELLFPLQGKETLKSRTLTTRPARHGWCEGKTVGYFLISRSFHHLSAVVKNGFPLSTLIHSAYDVGIGSLHQNITNNFKNKWTSYKNKVSRKNIY